MLLPTIRPAANTDYLDGIVDSYPVQSPYYLSINITFGSRPLGLERMCARAQMAPSSGPSHRPYRRFLRLNYGYFR